MVDTAFESLDIALLKESIFMTVGTHPEELRGFKVHLYDKVERHFELHSRTRSSSV